MPYSSTSDLPAQAKNLSPKQKRAFMQAFNSAHRDGKSEKSAFKIAWAAAKKSDGDESRRTEKRFIPRSSVEAMYWLGNLPAHYAKKVKG